MGRYAVCRLPRCCANSSLIGGKVLAYVLVVIGALRNPVRHRRDLFGYAAGSIAIGAGAGDTVAGRCAPRRWACSSPRCRARSAQAEAIGSLIVFALGFLSGAMSPVDPPYRGEGLMATITSFFPQSQTQLAYQTLMLQNGDVAAVLPQRVVLAGPVAGLLPDRGVALQN